MRTTGGGFLRNFGAVPFQIFFLPARRMPSGRGSRTGGRNFRGFRGCKYIVNRGDLGQQQHWLLAAGPATADAAAGAAAVARATAAAKTAAIVGTSIWIYDYDYVDDNNVILYTRVISIL